MHARYIPSRIKGKQRNRRSFIVWLTAVIIFAMALRFFVIEAVMVQGLSMEPTLYPGERLLIDKISYVFRAPQRNEVVVAYFDESEKPLVKRVIGLPGETIEIRDGLVYIDGQLLADDLHANGLRREDMTPVLIPPDYVFLMGDNRANSSDSTSRGPVSYRMLRGRGLLIIWPLSSIGLL